MLVLITGGAGFIGNALAAKLAGLGHAVTVLDNLSPQIHGEGADFPSALKSVARCLRGDVTDPAAWEPALEGQEAVVHLAAETGTGQSMYEIARYARVNVEGTALLLEACLRPGQSVRRIVLASSRAIYGEGAYRCGACGPFFPGAREAGRMRAGNFDPPCPACGAPGTALPTPEEAPPGPTSVYGVTKLAQEMLVTNFGRTGPVDAVALRFQNVYGPGQSLRNPYTGILSIFSTLIRQGRPINIFEDGLESRDFVFIDDVTEAIRLALETGALPHTVFNIGTGRGISVLRAAHLLFEACGREPLFTVSGDYRLGDIRHNFADTARAERALGFKAHIPFEEGLGKFMAWVLPQAPPDIEYDRSLRELRDKGLMKS